MNLHLAVLRAQQLYPQTQRPLWYGGQWDGFLLHYHTVLLGSFPVLKTALELKEELVDRSFSKSALEDWFAVLYTCKGRALGKSYLAG